MFCDGKLVREKFDCVMERYNLWFDLSRGGGGEGERIEWFEWIGLVWYDSNQFGSKMISIGEKLKYHDDDENVCVCVF